MSINLPYIEGISEKLRRIPRSHKIRSTFYTESTLPKLLCKPKDQVATEDKNKIVYQINCSNCEAAYFGLLWHLNGLYVQMNIKDLSGIAIVIRMKLQNTVGKQITILAGIKRKFLILGKAGYFSRRLKKL